MALPSMYERIQQSPQARNQGRMVEQVKVKATLEFGLPEDEEDLKAAIAAPDIMSGLRDLRDQVRSRLKYGPEPDRDFVEEVYQQLQEIAPYI